MVVLDKELGDSILWSINGVQSSFHGMSYFTCKYSFSAWLSFFAIATKCNLQRVVFDYTQEQTYILPLNQFIWANNFEYYSKYNELYIRTYFMILFLRWYAYCLFMQNSKENKFMIIDWSWFKNDLNPVVDSDYLLNYSYYTKHVFFFCRIFWGRW